MQGDYARPTIMSGKQKQSHGVCFVSPGLGTSLILQHEFQGYKDSKGEKTFTCMQLITIQTPAPHRVSLNPAKSEHRTSSKP